MPELTVNQKKAIERIDESLVVTAGAGSGKTLVLVERYLKLISQVDDAGKLKGHDRVIAITFTEKAATEMRAKVSRRLREMRKAKTGQGINYDELLEKLPMARISTIDSLCSDIVRRNPLHAGIIPDFDVISPSDSAILMERCVSQVVEGMLKGAAKAEKDLIIHIVNGCGKSLRDFTSSMAYVTNISAARGAFILNSQPPALSPEDKIATDIRDKSYAAYKQKLLQLRQVDFAGIEEAALRLMRSASGDRIRAGIDYVLVDEYQDTNELQDELVRLLVASPGAGQEDILGSDKLFIVGDPKQSIYAFRGANPSLFEGWIAVAEAKGKLVDLDFNFRSHPNLIRSFNAIFPTLLGESYKPAQSKDAPSDDDQRMKVIRAPYRRSDLEVESAADLIIKMVQEGVPLKDGRQARYGDIALLVSKNSHIEGYANEFRRKGIPYVVAKSDNIFGSDSIRFVSSLIGFILDPDDDTLAYSLLASPAVGVTEASIAALPMLDCKGIAKALINLQKDPQAYPDVFASGEFEKVSALSDLINFSLDKADSMSSYDLFNELDEQFALDELILEGYGRRGLANLRKILELIADDSLDLGSMEKLKQYIDMNADAKTEISEPDILDDNDNAVKIMTIHAAKGLEFPVVFVGKANFVLNETCKETLIIDPENRTLHSSVSSDFRKAATTWEYKQRQETSRLIYVAYTRALYFLFLSGSNGLKKKSASNGCYVFGYLQIIESDIDTNGNNPFDWIYIVSNSDYALSYYA